MRPATDLVDQPVDPPPGAVPRFEDLYATQFHHLTVQLFAYFGDREEAQEVVQEAFCRALARWAKVSQYDDPVAWVRRVAWNLATSRWRRFRAGLRLRHRYRAEPVAGPEPDRVALVAALATLPSPHRRAVVLHYLGDLTFRIGGLAATAAVECGPTPRAARDGRAVVDLGELTAAEIEAGLGYSVWHGDPQGRPAPWAIAFALVPTEYQRPG